MKSRVLRGVLALSALLITLCLCELAMRVFLPGEFVPSVERDALLGWRGRPNLSCIYRHALFNLVFPIEQNDAGFRDRGRTLAKPASTKRVLCVGDSYTWAWGLDAEVAYTRRLEERLAARGLDAEVINAGVPGYNTVQCLLYLRERGFAYDPDVVVYQASVNDFTGNRPCPSGHVWSCPWARLGDDDTVEIGGTPQPPMGFVQRLKYHGARGSRLVYLLKSQRDLRLQMAEQKAIGEIPGDMADAVSRIEADDVRLFAALLRDMRAGCAARGIRFVVLLDIPLTPERRAHLDELCPDTDILPVFDLMSAREVATDTLAYMPNDGHWTLEGHGWVAGYLAAGDWAQPGE